MMLTKPLCVLCLSSVLRRLCAVQSGMTNEFPRTFSSKKSNNRNKNKQTITVISKNDYITNELNSSISKHLKRQQKIWKNHREEERKFEQKLHYQSKIKDYDFDMNGKFQRFGKDSRKSEHDSGKNHNLHHKSNNKNWLSLSKSNIKPANKNDLVPSKLNEVSANGNVFSDDDSDEYDVEELQAPNWEGIDLVAINKSFYKPSLVTVSRSAMDIQEFHTKSHIKTSSTVPNPIFKFDEISELSPKIIAEIQRQGFDGCTPIQSQGIPLVLSGANAVAIAQSG